MYAFSFDVEDETGTNAPVNIVIHARSAPEAWIMIGTRILVDDIPAERITIVGTQIIL